MSIILFSRQVGSGKTTELMEWSRRQNNIAGILMPDIEGKRKIFNLQTKEIVELECPDPDNCSEGLIQVGRFYFYAAVFRQVNTILLQSLEAGPDWLVVDEVGKLELNGSGFYDSVNWIISAQKNKTTASKILLVVRENLCDEVISFFKIEDYIKAPDLKGPLFSDPPTQLL